MDAPPVTRVAQTFLRRELKPDEALLINEVRRHPKVDDAIKELAEHPPRVLVEAYCSRAFPTQSLGKRILIVLAGPLSNIIFAPLLLTLVFMYGVRSCCRSSARLPKISRRRRLDFKLAIGFSR